ncbi:hypothetical protein QE250_16905, partial [Chromatiaceae bacterium AAb-1]|nr:hypothetical protein [Chromatiaceae bacterium AAb-1]
MFFFIVSCSFEKNVDFILNHKNGFLLKDVIVNGYFLDNGGTPFLCSGSDTRQCIILEMPIDIYQEIKVFSGRKVTI